ncbi:Tubulin polyglutamylase ttll5 [Pleodorina starrii]|uniref:Tubulin polyglutamylase ttll5 n=1 Tax=Pleodorina starrii TaxID=330485 RepID=A0A9W6F2N8_9CHLO|nr:Tubulin polyglutamylase ttll5 [Pleodorina starrii]GLC53565.1 Tubulin polyglutamylase ttll5 [Pleodorina starrii]GLC65738.1 Tubulin polyglutamylase ttll5 [Pleodorina starrii]
MLVHGPSSLRVGCWSTQPSRRLVACSAKTKKAGGKPNGKGFGSAAPASLAPPKQQRGLELRILEDLPTVLVEPESEIDEATFGSCLFFMNKTEELCGRLPKLLDHAWAQATAQRIDDCISRPVQLASAPSHTTALHILSVKHDDCYNPALVTAVWDRVRPDAVALDVQPLYPKSFTRMAKAMDLQLLNKLLAGPLTSLSSGLDCADDVDRLRWHHAILQVVGQGASPILVTKAALFNVFANRDLHLSEAIAVAHLAARGPAAAGGGGGGGGSPVPVHGIDVEDVSMLAALGEDDFWTEADSAAYKEALLKATDPKLRSAVNTWLQGIPVGTSTTVPRQRFVLSRMEQALSRQQEEAHTLAHAAYRSSHSEPRVREQLQLQEARGAHMLDRLHDIASGRLGGRKCARLLAVMSSENAARVRRLAEAAAAAAQAAAGGATTPAGDN